jgi:hypothetical protein
MQLKQPCKAVQTAAVTVAVRRVNPCGGTTHTYTLNGTLMRDVLVEGQWITVSTGEPLKTRAA